MRGIASPALALGDSQQEHRSFTLPIVADVSLPFPFPRRDTAASSSPRKKRGAGTSSKDILVETRARIAAARNMEYMYGQNVNTAPVR